MTSNPLQMARDQGYEDEDILEFIKQRPEYQEKIEIAEQNQYSPTEIIEFLSSQQQSDPSLLQKIGTSGKEFLEHKKEGVRQVGRSVSRAAETLIGLPKDLLETQKFLLTRAAEGIAGSELPYVRKALDNAEVIMPTYYMQGSQDLKEGVQSLSRGFLAPQNEAEALADDIVADTVALMVPFKMKSPFWKSLLRPGAISAISNVVGKGIGKLTGSDKAQQYAKLGTMLLTSLMSPRGMESSKKYINKLYNQAEQAINPDAILNATKVEDSLRTLRDKVLAQRPKASLAKSEKFVIDEIDHILGSIQGGGMPVESAWAHKRALNEKLMDLLYESPTKATKGRARHLAKQLTKQLDNALVSYGKENPAFGLPFEEAEEAFAVRAKSRPIQSFIQGHAQNLGKSAGGLALLHFLTGKSVVLKGAAKGLTAALAVGKPAQIAYEISKSSALQRHYLNVIKAAALEDSVTLNKEIRKMQKELEKENHSSS